MLESSFELLKMEGSHRKLLLFISLWILMDLSYCKPCGAGSYCSCFDEINLITCAAKGLTHFPNMDAMEKMMCKTLILDMNKITSLADFELSEWPQIKELRIRKNPKEICEWTSDLREHVRGRVVITDDCDKSADRSPSDKVSGNIQTPNLAKIKPNDVTTRPISTPGLIEEKTDSSDLDKSGERSDGDGDGQSTMEITSTMDITITTPNGYYENTSAAGEWGLDAAISSNKVVIVISVPLSILGIISVFVVKIIWSRNNPRSLSVNVSTRSSRSGWFNCCNKKKHKTSPSPSESGFMMGGHTYDNRAALSTSPSLFSINSNVSDDDLFAFRSHLPSPAYNPEGNYLNICHIIHFIHLNIIHICRVIDRS